MSLNVPVCPFCERPMALFYETQGFAGFICDLCNVSVIVSPAPLFKPAPVALLQASEILDDSGFGSGAGL